MKTDPKAAVFWVGVGGAVWKPAKQVLVGKLKEQGDRAVSSELCYRVLTGTRARIWVKAVLLVDYSSTLLFPLVDYSGFL